MAESLEVLEKLTLALTEFFSPITSNDRKREIGSELEVFQKNPAASVFAVQFLDQSRDQNVLMYLLQCLQNSALKRWPAVEREFKSKIRVVLLDLVPSWNQRFPPFLTGKLLKLIAEIARFDWPHEYPELSLRLSQWLVEGKNHFKAHPREDNLALVTGLRLVLTLMEEFCVGRCPLLTPAQKEKQSQHLRTLLIPGILDLIHELLTITMDFLVVLSPGDACGMREIGNPLDRFVCYTEIALRSTIRTGSFQLESVIPRQVIAQCVELLRPSSSDEMKRSLGITHKLDEQFVKHEVSEFSMEWNPNVELSMSVVFTLSEFGTQEVRDVGGGGQSQSVSALSIQCLTEAAVNRPLSSAQMSDPELLLEFNSSYAPIGGELSHVMTWHLFEMARSLLKEVSSKSKDEFTLMDDTFLRKLTEFVSAFIYHRLHLTEKALHSSPVFQSRNITSSEITDFMLDLCNLTEACRIDGERFLCCLECWQIFFEYLMKKRDSEDGSGMGVYPGLVERLTRIMVGVFSFGDRLDEDRTAFAGSGNLTDLPAEAIFICDQAWDSWNDEEGEQASPDSWNGISKPAAEVVASLALVDFHCVFGRFWDAFKPRVEAYFTLENNLCEAIKTRVNEEKLMWLMADLQNLMRIMSRLNCFFINDYFHANKDKAKDLVELICRAIVFSAKMRFWVEKALGSQLKLYLANVFSGFLLCLRSYCHWIAQFYADAQRTGENNETVSAMITASLDTVIPLLLHSLDGGDSSVCISRCSTSLLFSLLTTVRPQGYVLSMGSVGRLYESVSRKPEDLRLHFPPRAMRILVSCMGSYLVVPWHQAVDCEQEWTHRKKLYRTLMAAVFQQLILALNKELKDSSLQELEGTLERWAMVYVDVLTGIENEGSKTKQMVHVTLSTVSSGVLKWLGLMSGHLTSKTQRVVELLLQMLKAAFGTLCVQMGADFAKQTVDTLLGLSRTGSSGDAVELGCKATELLLGILKMIACEMSRAFATFTESIVDLALNNLYPRVVSGDLVAPNSIDAREAFYLLLYSIVDWRWRHFFPSGVGGGTEWKKENLPPWMDPTPSPSSSTDHHSLLAQRGVQLRAILEAFGRSLNEESEPQIVKGNMGYLNSLNTKWALYKKFQPIFQSGMLVGFVEALCSLYIREKHPLLSEDIAETVFNMVTSTDEAAHALTAEVLPEFLVNGMGLAQGQAQALLNSFKMESDSHSFCANFTQMICQIRMYQLCNAM